MKEFLVALLLMVFIGNIQGSYSESTAKDAGVTYGIIKEQLNDVRENLEKFNSFYLINLDQRMMNIMTTMTSLDTNIKVLQEKAQVWDIFQHHIGAWSEHIKSVDHKLDLLKRTHESSTHPLETKIQNMEFKVQHIFEKVDVINEKLHDITKTVYSLSSLNHRGRRNDRVDVHDQGAVLNKLNAMQKQINKLENGAPKKAKLKKESTDSDEEFDELLDKLTTKKLKELASTRKNTRSLDSISALLRSVDERTIRIYDLEANQFEQLLTCCKRTDHEITTFTNSADILLKRIESLVLNVDSKLEKSDDHFKGLVNTTQLIEEKEVGSGDTESTVEIGSGTGESEATENEIVHHYPKKNGCHQLKQRENGIYTFGVSDVNDLNRDFNRRHCVFTNSGPAWTVIQRRYLQDIQENFNRTWHDYKHGFGDLNQEFWFGNYFIHKLTFEDNVELRIELEDFSGNSAWTEYTTFRLDSEKFNFNLNIGDYKGNASDSLIYHNGQDFSTFDRNHDKSDTVFPCALTYGSGWWYNNCAESNLNGVFYEEPNGHNYGGVLWENWLGDYSLKSTKMMIRPKDIWLEDNEDFMEATFVPPQDP